MWKIYTVCIIIHCVKFCVNCQKIPLTWNLVVAVVTIIRYAVRLIIICGEMSPHLPWIQIWNLSIWQIFSTRGTCDKYQACNCCYLAKLKQIFGWLNQLVEAKKADILMKRLCIKYVLSTCSIGRGGVSKCTLLKNARQQRSFWTSPVQLNWSRLHLFWKICRNTHFFCC